MSIFSRIFAFATGQEENFYDHWGLERPTEEVKRGPVKHGRLRDVGKAGRFKIFECVKCHQRCIAIDSEEAKDIFITDNCI